MCLQSLFCSRLLSDIFFFCVCVSNRTCSTESEREKNIDMNLSDHLFVILALNTSSSLWFTSHCVVCVCSRRAWMLVYLWQIVCYRSNTVHTPKKIKIKTDKSWNPLAHIFHIFPGSMNYNHWSVSLGRFIATAWSGVAVVVAFLFIPFNIFIDMAMCVRASALTHKWVLGKWFLLHLWFDILHFHRKKTGFIVARKKQST